MPKKGIVVGVIVVLLAVVGFFSLVFFTSGHRQDSSGNVPPATKFSWQEEYKEAKSFGANVLYLCSMNVNCAEYTEKKLVGLCVLAPTEDASTMRTTTVAVSRGNTASATPPERVRGATSVRLKECRKASGFTRR